MTTSAEQLAAVYEEFGEPHDGWTDSLSLEALLCAAHEHGLLRDVWVYQLLDDDRDMFLVSVEACPTVFVHPLPILWREVRPEPGMGGLDAVRHLLERLDAVAGALRANFLREVAEVVSGVLMPTEDAGSHAPGQ